MENDDLIKTRKILITILSISTLILAIETAIITYSMFRLKHEIEKVQIIANNTKKVIRRSCGSFGVKILKGIIN